MFAVSMKRMLAADGAMQLEVSQMIYRSHISNRICHHHGCLIEISYIWQRVNVEGKSN